jgi:predicted phage tail protein
MSPPPLEHIGPLVEGFAEVYTGSGLGTRIGKLQPGVAYCLHLHASNAFGESACSEGAVFTTAATVPFIPLPPIVTHATSDSVSLAWLIPDGQGARVSAYTLEMGEGAMGDGRTAFRFVADTDDTQHTVSNLLPGLTYQFRVRAENCVGKSAFSKPAAAMTGAALPGQVAAPTVARSDTTTVTVVWAPPPDDGGSPMVGYEVEMQTPWAPERAMREWQKMFMVVAEEVTLQHLRPGSPYRVRVRALNCVGAGPPTHPRGRPPRHRHPRRTPR